MTGTDLNDGKVLQEFIASGNEAWFEEIVRRHGAMVMGVCLRLLRHRQDAEDATQAAMLTLAHQAKTLTRHVSVAAWLHGVAKNVSRDALKAKVRRVRRERKAADMTPDSGDDRSSWEEIGPLLDDELDHLPEKFRQPLILRYLQGMSEEETARRLDWSEGTLSARLVRGREMLRSRLSRRGAAVTGAVLFGLIEQHASAMTLTPTILSSTANAASLLATGKSALASTQVNAQATMLMKGALKTMLWIKVKSVAAVIAAGVVVASGSMAGIAGLQAAEAKPADRQGALAGLPSKPGPHMDKIKALGDDEWVQIGTPAPDPKWGVARGRSWSSRMPYAPDLQGGFYNGQGIHGFVKPDGHYMDDVFFYDLNGNRWICLYPGTEVENFAAKATSGELKYNQIGQLVDKNGDVVPVLSSGGHSYSWHTYDSDTRTYLIMAGNGLDGNNSYGTFSAARTGSLQGPPGMTAQAIGSPVLFNTMSGKFERFAVTDTPRVPTFRSMVMYAPSRKVALTFESNATFQYDVAGKKGWTAVASSGPAPDTYDCVACYDSKRDCVYARSCTYDVKTNSWSAHPCKGALPGADNTAESCVHYDSLNDRIVQVVYANKMNAASQPGVYICDPETWTWTQQKPLPFAGTNMTVSAFYSPEVNAHVFYLAPDSGNEQATAWVYRYQNQKKKK